METLRNLVASKWQDLVVNALAALVAFALGALATPFFLVLAAELVFTCVVRVCLNKRLQQAASTEIRNDILGVFMGNAFAAICPIPLSGTIFCSVVFWCESRLRNR
jgi:O-antigen ligase